MDITQTEIDELRRLHEGCLKGCGGAPCTLVCRSEVQSIAVLPRLLAALEEARAERDNALHSMRVAEQCAGMANAERDKANLRERNIFASIRIALGEDLGGGGGLVEILNGIEELQEQRDAFKAKLAALVEAMEHIRDIMGGHDGCQGFSSPEDVWGIADKALAAAKVQP